MISFESITSLCEAFNFETKLISVIICGLLIGVEREFLRKPAGLRTCAMVCMGSMLFTHLSLVVAIEVAKTMAVPIADVTRIASVVVQGVSFLCGGVIFFFRDKLLGITTAAVLWVVAAIGMSIGFNHYKEGFEVTAATLFILFIVGLFERKFTKRSRIKKVRRITV